MPLANNKNNSSMIIDGNDKKIAENKRKQKSVDYREKFTFTINPGIFNAYSSLGGNPILYTASGSNPYKAENMQLSYRYYKNTLYLQVNVYLQKRLEDHFDVSVPIKYWIPVDGAFIEMDQSKNPISSYNTSSNTTDNSKENNGDSSGGENNGDAEIKSAEFDALNGANAVNLSSTASLSDLMSNSMHGIFGIPYQWMSIADRRIEGSAFGRKYAEKIAARMPLLFLTPCRPCFLSGATKKQKSNIISTFFDKTAKDNDELIDTLLGDTKEGVSRFYTANFAYDEYYRYVNVCCQTTAKLLHLDGKGESVTKEYGIKISDNDSVKKFDRFNWAKSLSSEFTDYFSSVSAIPFYINANVSVSESINNDTSESSLAGTVKSKEAQAKELQYLLNTAGAASSGGLVGDISSWATGLTSSLASKSTASNFLSSVANSMSSVAAGGSMMFPELWSSSSMGRSYQIDIKLRSPDGDALSVYLNVLVPLYHLLCLAAPQMMNTNYNVYFSPFLVKAYCKSMFNIDMGIITSMDISKGKEGDWNANGIPTSVDVSLTIKDLYDVFSLTPYDEGIDLQLPLLDGITGKDSSSAKKIIRNTAMMDYICNNAGLNLNQNEIGRQITVYKLLRQNNILNWPGNKWLKLQKTVDNSLAKIYRSAANNRR